MPSKSKLRTPVQEDKVCNKIMTTLYTATIENVKRFLLAKANLHKSSMGGSFYNREKFDRNSDIQEHLLLGTITKLANAGFGLASDIAASVIKYRKCTEKQAWHLAKAIMTAPEFFLATEEESLLWAYEAYEIAIVCDDEEEAAYEEEEETILKTKTPMNCKNYHPMLDTIAERMVKFTYKAPEHLRGHILPVFSGADSLSWEEKLNLSTLEGMLAVREGRENYNNCEWPTLNDLLAEGIVEEWLPYREECLMDADQYECEYICDYFESKGLKVSEDAIMWCRSAWKDGWKSGYRDDENGVYVRCAYGIDNPCNIWVYELHPTCESWQKTYIC